MKASVVCSMVCALAAMPLALQGQTVGAPAVDNRSAPQMRFEAEDFIKLKPGENLGEVLGVAVQQFAVPAQLVRFDMELFAHEGSDAPLGRTVPLRCDRDRPRTATPSCARTAAAAAS
jgi:hypothetical protein